VQSAIADIQEFWTQRFPADFGRDYRPVSGLRPFDGSAGDAPSCAVAGTPETTGVLYCPVSRQLAWDTTDFVPRIKTRYGALGLVEVFAQEIGRAAQPQLFARAPTRLPRAALAQQVDCLSGAYVRFVASDASRRFQLGSPSELSRVIAAALTRTGPAGATSASSAFDRISAFQLGYTSGDKRCRTIDAADVARRSVRLDAPPDPAPAQAMDEAAGSATQPSLAKNLCMLGARTVTALAQWPLPAAPGEQAPSTAALDAALTEALLNGSSYPESPGDPQSGFNRVALFHAGFAYGPGACATALAPGSREGKGMFLGVTHTQYSLDSWEDPQQLQAGEHVLAAAPGLQNQHIMGWGVENPEPAPGVYNWPRLDERMKLISRTGGTPVLTLCGAPDWMKGGQPGHTDWNKLDVAPTRAHYQDFANLAAAVAQRYPHVRYFQVWNELKGFWDDRHNRWNYEAFTEFYNVVYDAVKAVRPDAQIGGPYVVLDAWADASTASHPSQIRGPWGVIDQRPLDLIDYWMRHKHGADFLTVDGGTGTKDQGLITDPFAANHYLAAATHWLVQRTGLPVWWSEFYPDVPGDASPAQSPQRAAVTLDAIAAATAAGATVMLLWSPQAEDGFNYAALWTAPSSTSGVRPTALTEPWAWLAPRLANGATTVARGLDGRTLTFTAPDGTLVVNLADYDWPAEVAGTAVHLAPYGTHIAQYRTH
jgi:hypothetical protein